ncbi:hypothetical protein NDU88_004632 [Pleurodeles waltl]|uniref:Uncharacterized protein n=1 Tax=Pleurodeles waltl TaxID=8319 RepID=A0AAV7MXS9_PLEWA|nr:hypothetical protein NDU88_004632 [Pleurodeles waltl]
MDAPVKRLSAAAAAQPLVPISESQGRSEERHPEAVPCLKLSLGPHGTGSPVATNWSPSPVPQPCAVSLSRLQHQRTTAQVAPGVPEPSGDPK